MRSQIVTCDICKSKSLLSDWVHLPFRKSFVTFEFHEIDLCGAPCEATFWVYYDHYVKGTQHDISTRDMENISP